VGWLRCSGLYGDLASGSGFASGSFSAAAGFDAHNFFVMAQALLNRDFTFCSICDFNELARQKEHLLQLLGYMPGTKLLMT
jgi:hypothetical protein